MPASARAAAHQRVGERLERALGRAGAGSGGRAGRPLRPRRDAPEPSLPRACRTEGARPLRVARGGRPSSRRPRPARRAGSGSQRDAEEARAPAPLAPAVLVTEGWAEPEAERAYERARELGQALDDVECELGATFGLAAIHEMRGEYPRSRLLEVPDGRRRLGRRCGLSWLSPARSSIRADSPGRWPRRPGCWPPAPTPSRSSPARTARTRWWAATTERRWHSSFWVIPAPPPCGWTPRSRPRPGWASAWRPPARGRPPAPARRRRRRGRDDRCRGAPPGTRARLPLSGGDGRGPARLERGDGGTRRERARADAPQPRRGHGAASTALPAGAARPGAGGLGTLGRGAGRARGACDDRSRAPVLLRSRAAAAAGRTAPAGGRPRWGGPISRRRSASPGDRARRFSSAAPGTACATLSASSRLRWHAGLNGAATTSPPQIGPRPLRRPRPTPR